MQRVHRLTVAPVRGQELQVEAAEGVPARVEIVGDRSGGESTFRWSRAALADIAPMRVIWDDPEGRSIPDFDNRLMLSVSGRARGLIEAIEPAVHHFIPVVYCDRDGRVLEQRYVLIVAQATGTRRIGRAHLWHDGSSDQAPCISETLAAALQTSGLTGLCWD
jgi:hypothetical protein